MARKSNISVISKAIAYLLIVLLIAGSIGFFAYYTNGFTRNFTTFYIKYDDELYSGIQNMKFKEDKARFDIVYPLNFLSEKDLKDYSLKVIPNKENNFTFKVDGMDYTFTSELDLTSGFDIEKQEDYFLINNNYTIQSVLEKIYNGKTVEVPEDIDYNDYFTLVISSYNNETTIYINFNKYIYVEKVTLDPRDIIL
jgi:hypothetical protein